ncbi:hypothetical protein [Streptomyces sp. NPDC001070]
MSRRKVEARPGPAAGPDRKGLLELNAVEPAEVLTAVDQYLDRLFIGDRR